MVERRAGPRWLSEPEMRAWRALLDVSTGVMAVLDAELRAEHGISLGEYEVLVHISEAPGDSLRMTDLAASLRLSPSGITRRVDGLVERARGAPAVPLGPSRLQRGVDRGGHTAC